MLQRFGGGLLPGCPLPDHYPLMLESDIDACPLCGKKMRKQWTVRRRPVSLILGKPDLTCGIKQCPGCKYIQPPEQLREIIPENCNYGYDVILAAGTARYIDNLQNQETAERLEEKFGVAVPLSSIGVLARRFLDYLAAIHYHGNAGRIKSFLAENGGYILHLDGTCENGTDVLFSVIDGVSGIVLANTKMKTENEKDISELLEKCRNLYGRPLAVVRDLSEKIESAVGKVFGEITDLICHYHFLENVGGKIFDKEYAKLGTLIRKTKILGDLNSLRKNIAKAAQKGRIATPDELEKFLNDPETTECNSVWMKRSIANYILKWLSDYKADLSGEYYPFELPNLALCRRCERVMTLLEKVFAVEQVAEPRFHTLETIYEKLELACCDKTVAATVKKLKDKETIFIKLRNFLRMNAENGDPVLRQRTGENANMPISNLREAFGTFIDEIKTTAGENENMKKAVKIISEYISKYENKLIGHILPSGNGNVINARRTNNIMELSFCDVKRNMRKRIGSKKLTRPLHLIHQDVMLIKNFRNEQYRRIIGIRNIGDLLKLFPEYCTAKTYIKKCAHKVSPLNYVPRKMLRNKKMLKRIENVLMKNFFFLHAS